MLGITAVFHKKSIKSLAEASRGYKNVIETYIYFFKRMYFYQNHGNCEILTNSEGIKDSVGIRSGVHVEYDGVFSGGVVDVQPWGQE